jgi:FkbM family methyltransferase
MSALRKFAKRLLRGAGYKIERISPVTNLLEHKRWLLAREAIDLVIDVGANTGQFASELRNELGFRGQIISFEPLRSAFTVLSSRARGDDRWKVVNCALGEKSGSLEINVSANSYSSSLLDMLPAHVDSAPDSNYIATETVEIRTLDEAMPELRKSPRKIFMKIDTQGYESQVLRGARASLPRIDTIQLELSLVPLYAGQALFSDIHQQMCDQGYSLVVIEPMFRDPRTKRLLQMDGIYHRFGD